MQPFLNEIEFHKGSFYNGKISHMVYGGLMLEIV